MWINTVKWGVVLLFMVLASSCSPSSLDELPSPTIIYTETPEPSLTPKPTSTRTPRPSRTPTATLASSWLIAFSDNEDIYVMNPDGSGIRRLTDDSRLDSDPAWSPDGSQIVFLSRPDSRSFSDIFVMNADGTNARNITNNDNNNKQPAWSPDGTKIAFTFDCDIHVISADGTGVVNLREGQPPQFCFKHPTWSSDGTKIAYIMGDENYDKKSGIYVMRSDGRGKMAISITGQELLIDGPLAWSPDGTRFAFQGRVEGDYEIFVMNSNGKEITQLTDNDYDDTDPAWSPDGTVIAFSSLEQIYTILIDEFGVFGLFELGGLDSNPEYDPSWLP